MTDHEHRPTLQNYLWHWDKTRSKNWTGKHSLICRHCGKEITRQRSLSQMLPTLISALLLFAFSKLNKDLIANPLVWLAALIVLLLVAGIVDYRAARYVTLSEYHGAPEQSEDA